LQPAEASIRSLRAFLVFQPSLILQFAGQIYPSWWTTFRGLLQARQVAGEISADAPGTKEAIDEPDKNK
ncbi:hypothetical protein, partial [Flavimaricola marinus]|uniref:hypothetical protein n=1 Tax=Flavimaricola marinus TaxID=1819565 RepID=UPI001B3B409C